MEEETRKNAIFRYMVDGESPKDIYTNLHRSKKWFFKWLKRFQSGDSHWYEDQSRAPLIKIRETGHHRPTSSSFFGFYQQPTAR